MIKEIFTIFASFAFCVTLAVATPQPNVILVMTDDQGYGDLGCHGNPFLKTPEIDKLHGESIRFTDFHVSSFCTPTRAALMTGNHPGYSGAFRDAKLAGANFRNITWGVSTDGLTQKTEFFFSGGPGSTTAADKHLAVTFEGADLSRITGAAKTAMIQNLGKFDGETAIGAKYNDSTLTKSGWTAAELDAAGWRRVE
ncbi:MAG: sulfatase-like hydrolase/transferase [Opitutales bacterium]|jgi:hypothetical protein|nr:sulfatase-like hydrolase/transferase [Opitutales bacterium]MDP4643458.1 sulfatase-like hydrolase/transferase [Opitutales bacterium]MDP4778499.1 sulfatase-like hydrolase/transferase [Opitutales bacterium]MDP5079469.1 sulfatase-like hydrolase/transferase [Opitutales bacterium]